jgi:hypothetical protein
MSQLKTHQTITVETVDPRWMGLCRIGVVAAFILAASSVFAVIAYFIWPYAPGFKTTEAVFGLLQKDRFAGLISLDFLLLVTSLVTVLFYPAVYVSLKRINESLALIALIIGIISVAIILPARPILEIIALSDKYAAAASEAEKIRYLAAGEGLLSLFNGTAWAVWYGAGVVSGLISSILMLRSAIFGKVTGWVGIISNIAAGGIFIPVIGLVLAMLAMPGFIAYNILVGIKLMRVCWNKSGAG